MIGMTGKCSAGHAQQDPHFFWLRIPKLSRSSNLYRGTSLRAALWSSLLHIPRKFLSLCNENSWHGSIVVSKWWNPSPSNLEYESSLRPCISQVDEHICRFVFPYLQVALHLYHDVITAVPFFKECGKFFLTEIIIRLTTKTLSPGDYLFEVSMRVRD